MWERACPRESVPREQARSHQERLPCPVRAQVGASTDPTCFITPRLPAGPRSGSRRAFMPWIAASLLSAFFLGCYELGIKHAVRDNAVLPVLFFANLVSAGVWGGLLALAAIMPASLPATLHVAALTPLQHAQLLLKSVIVSASWV